MMSELKRILLRVVATLTTERRRLSMLRKRSRELIENLVGAATDDFLEVLLAGLDVAFALSKGYRRNIKGFTGRYLFRTAGDKVQTSVIFADGDMTRDEGSIDDWDTRVTFKDPAALRRFLFAKDPDILDSLLANDVDVDGNLNYIYKFGFMVRDLGQRLGIA